MPARGRATRANPYDRTHRRDRARLLAALVDGTACGHCGYPMYRDQQLDADHSDAVTLGRGGRADRLLHASCNRSRGASLGNRLRARRAGQRRSTQATRGRTPPPEW